MKFDVPSHVINKLFDNGYEEQIIDIVQEFENDNSREVSDIPLSPTIMQDSEDEIILLQQVYEEYKKMVEKIKNPNTSQEIPYILLGNRKEINGRDIIFIENITYCNNSSLDDLHVSIDEQQFRQLASNSPYSVISIGHTHGNVSEDKKEKSLVRNISDEVKQKYDLRDIGLNISVSDIWQHEAFRQIAQQYGNKEVFQTVIMYNGDIIMMNSNGISKSNSIQSVLSNGEIISLPTGISRKDINKQIR